MRYSKAVQLVHEFSGALLCVDVQERAESEGFAMKVVLKTVEPPSGKQHVLSHSRDLADAAGDARSKLITETFAS